MKKAYVDSFAVEREAGTVPPDQIRSVLERAIAPGPYLDFLVQDDLDLRRKGWVPWGAIVPHPVKVEITGASAVLHDCADESNSGMADKKTGQLIPSTRGDAFHTSVVKLTQGGDQRWLVAEIRGYAQRCSRP